MTPLFHWLPKPWRVSLVRRFALGHWPRASTIDEAVEIVESARLLDRRMVEALFPGEPVITERLFLLPKSYMVLAVDMTDAKAESRRPAASVIQAGAKR
jgi:hypothetical protein